MKQIELGLDVEADLRRHRRVLGRDDPWFGRYQVETQSGLVTVRVGHRAEADHAIVDWRDVASQPLFDANLGDAVEVDLGHRQVQGRLHSRARVDLGPDRQHQEELFAVSGPVPGDPSGEEAMPPEPRSDREPGPSGPRWLVGPAQGLPDVLGLLTPAQYRLITSTRDRPVILRGRAGSGKTTVGLYRVAYLAYPDHASDRPPLDPERVMVVMFNRALSAYVRSLLEPLGLGAASIDTFHGWAFGSIQKICGAHRVVTEPHEGGEEAARVKRHPGILNAIEAFVARQRGRSRQWLEPHLRAYGALDVLEQLDAEVGPLVTSLVRVLHRVRLLRDRARGGEHQRLEQVVRILEQAHHRLTQYPQELKALMTDRPLLQAHLDGIPPWDIDSAARFQTWLQAESRLTFEDFAVLLRLMQEKNGGLPDPDHPGRVLWFEHLMVDEAQDFGPVELDVLFRTVRQPADLTLVGDSNQKIVPDADFIGWSAVAKRLGLDRAAVAQLEIGHRCTEPIMALADHVLTGTVTRPRAGREGPLPTLDPVDSDEDEVRVLADRIRRRSTECPAAHLCVVTRHREAAEALATSLGEALQSGGGRAGGPDIPVRWGHNRSFVFAPGVTVTNVRQLKGLEFDTVFVVRPDVDAYPDTPESRRLLYTMLTRAQNRLHLVTRSEVSPILQPAVDAGQLEVTRERLVRPVAFRADEDLPF